MIYLVQYYDGYDSSQTFIQSDLKTVHAVVNAIRASFSAKYSPPDGWELVGVFREVLPEWLPPGLVCLEDYFHPRDFVRNQLWEDADAAFIRWLNQQWVMNQKTNDKYWLDYFREFHKLFLNWEGKDGPVLG